MQQEIRFLVIDDDEVDRTLVRRSLTKAGFIANITEAASAEEALTLIHHHSFDFGFLDYLLPDSDGLELLLALREAGLGVPIVVLTGQGDEKIAVELMKAGASDYLTKSLVKPERLKQTVENALRLYRAEQLIEETQANLRETNELLRQKNELLEQQKQQIQAKNQALIEAARVKSEFMATVSHELRTPMHSIIGFSQVLDRQVHGSLNEKQSKMVGRILKNSQQLQVLIDDLLDFSKIGAEGIRLQPTPFNIHDLIAETVGDIQRSAERKNIELKAEYLLTNPQVINDPVRLRQVLSNLLTNAVKFTNEGHIRVSISSGHRALENHEDNRFSDWLILGVEDTGIGIDPIHQPVIFNAFLQIDQSMTRRKGGTGLGLAISQSLVELMGGHIELQSTPGQGSHFQIIFPRRLTDA